MDGRELSILASIVSSSLSINFLIIMTLLGVYLDKDNITPAEQKLYEDAIRLMLAIIWIGVFGILSVGLSIADIWLGEVLVIAFTSVQVLSLATGITVIVQEKVKWF